MGESRTSLLSRDPAVKEVVVAVGEQYLALCDALVDATRLDREGDPLCLAVGVCLVYYISKIQRVTRSALTLILTGQGAEAMSLIREQNDFVMALNYYSNEPQEAQLFLASQVLLKRNFAKQIMAFDKRAAADPKRVAQLREIERDVAIAYKKFPGLRKPKGRSGSTNAPVLIDWSEPSPFEIFRAVMNRLLRERYAAIGKPVDQLEFSKRLDTIVARTYFFRNTYISQDKHATALDVGAHVEPGDDGKILCASHQVDDPSGLAYHFIQNAMPPLLAFRDHHLPGQFERELTALAEAHQEMRHELSIVDEPIDLIADLN